MNTLVALAVATLVMLAAHPALAQDKTLAIVVKGLDNPFFEQINLGCQKWNAENKGKGYTCLYTGPASSTDEAGEVQIVDDLLTKGVAAIAISPSNAPLMANLLKKKAPKIPVMTIDADLAKEDAASAQDLSRDRQLSDGREVRRVPEEVQAQGRHHLPAAGQRGRRQHQRSRRRYPRHPGRRQGHQAS